MFNPTLVDPRRHRSVRAREPAAGVGTNYGVPEPFNPYLRDQPLSGLFASGPNANRQVSSNIGRLKTPRRKGNLSQLNIISNDLS